MDEWDGKKYAKLDESVVFNDTASIDYNNEKQNCNQNGAGDNNDNGFAKNAIIFEAKRALSKNKTVQPIQKLRRFDVLWKNLEQIKSISAGMN